MGCPDSPSIVFVDGTLIFSHSAPPLLLNPTIPPCSLCGDIGRRGRVPADDSDDTGGGDKDMDKDKDKKQGSTWGSLFAGAGQVGRSGGMSPTRSSEVKKAIRAAMAFGLPKGAGAGAGAEGGKESGRSSPAGGKGDGPEKEKGEADEGTRICFFFVTVVRFG